MSIYNNILGSVKYRMKLHTQYTLYILNRYYITTQWNFFMNYLIHLWIYVTYSSVFTRILLLY